ncbi:hypothetical protein [Rubinisphaera sp.]|uniref:hypothetical protein n=1 Tax=Rubinisphaera sp. TaxID=2024857 RepID=UPI000C0C5AC5|nr:hypothetical protein [Rubinisphaera sp.]MBV09535.1 hypothetical protein [Rubinisphaera sp.]HCS53504.1 hypothetical protein [Planctomycetaceae bacterium]
MWNDWQTYVALGFVLIAICLLIRRFAHKESACMSCDHRPSSRDKQGNVEIVQLDIGKRPEPRG